jgi:hypothetical protein
MNNKNMSTKTSRTSTETWMPEARKMAAQCWCDDETSGIEMDPRLAESVARRIAGWMDEAARACRNADYYRGLLVECGNTIGQEAHTQDDGGIVPTVLVAKVPELVSSLKTALSRVSEERDRLREELLSSKAARDVYGPIRPSDVSSHVPMFAEKCLNENFWKLTTRPASAEKEGE